MNNKQVEKNCPDDVQLAFVAQDNISTSFIYGLKVSYFNVNSRDDVLCSL